MHITLIAEVLQVPLKKVVYWRKALKDQGMLDKSSRGIKERFGSRELAFFMRIKEYTHLGATATDAVRMMRENTSPLNLRRILDAERMKNEHAILTIQRLERELADLKGAGGDRQ